MAAKTLTVVAGEIEAEAVCALLRVNGIACNHRRTDRSAAVGTYFGGAMASPTEVLVDEADLEAARLLLPS
jgi:hypothetical protein